MDSKVKTYIERAENELRLAKAVFNMSQNEKIKIELEANIEPAQESINNTLKFLSNIKSVLI